MIKYIIILFLSIGMVHIAKTQGFKNMGRELQVNYLMEFDVNGNRYGGAIEYNIMLLNSSSETYQLSSGIFNEFFLKDERDIDGITGNTKSNILGITISNRLYFLQNKKLTLTNTLYAGWGHRSTNANYTNDRYSINRDYKSTYNYVAFGAYWKVGYQLRERIILQTIGKTDFSRVVDEYQATLFERPGFMYGFGVTYIIQ